MTVSVPVAILSVAFVTACASSGSNAEREPEQQGVSFERGAVVLTGPALEDGSGTLLGTMAGKVPNLRIHRTDHCPEITLRSYVSYVGLSNPHVYVDGTRATDTCVLETLRSSDVQRVEVYPQGYTRRPGYSTHAPGLILVFMRSG